MITLFMKMFEEAFPILSEPQRSPWPKPAPANMHAF